MEQNKFEAGSSQEIKWLEDEVARTKNNSPIYWRPKHRADGPGMQLENWNNQPLVGHRSKDDRRSWAGLDVNPSIPPDALDALRKMYPEEEI